MRKLRKKLLTGALAICFALSSIVSPTIATAVPNSQSTASATSIYGVDQYETAANIAQKGWPTASDYAIVAAGMPANLIDALAAGPLAAKLNAPILLSEGTRLNNHTKEELGRLKVKKVYITSGPAVIKQGVIDELKAISSVEEVKPLGGYDASHTSVNIAKEMENLGVKVSKVVVTGGAGSDALSIAPIAGAQGIPILYTSRNSLSREVLRYLEDKKANLTSTYVIGGTGVISDTLKAQLPGIVERYWGQNQYDTNLEVLKHFAGDLKNNITYVANGETLVDALAGVPLAVQDNSPILLIGKTMTNASLKYAQSHLSPNVIGLGGESVVPPYILAQLAPSEIISLDGSSKGSRDPKEPEQFKGIVKVTGDNVTLENAKTNYSIYVQGDNATLTNLTVQGTIFLDPGDTGSATLQNVHATNIVILSGAEHSIKLMDVIAALLNVQSNSPNVRVDATGATRFEHTQSSSSAIFEAADGTSFGTIRITYSSQTTGGVPVVELIGDFPETIEVGGGVTVIAAPGSNISNLMVTPDNPEQTVTLSGNFNSVEVNTQANVTLDKNTTITKVVAKAESKILVPPSASIKEFDAGSTGTTPTGGGSVGGKTTTDSNSSTGSGSGSGSSGSGGNSGSSVAVSSVTVSPTTMTLTAGGATGSITPTITPANATNKSVVWTSNNETVATVTNGVVTPKAAGTTSIVVKTNDGNKTAECFVTVVAAQPQTEVELEIIIAEEDGIWVTVLDKASNELILELPKEAFSLSDASGNAVEFKFNDPEVRDPNIPDHEYFLSPVTGNFEGTYTLTFTKSGYQSISQEFTIGTGTSEGEILDITFPSAAYTAGVSHTISVTVETSGIVNGTEVTLALVGPGVDDIVVDPVAGIISDNTATIEFTVPATVPAGIYYIAAEVTGVMPTYNTVTLEAAPNEDQAAPTGLAGVAPTAALTDGKITGTTTAMEYKLASADDSAYAACSETETIVVAAGDYVVRLAAKTGFNAGATAAVTVPAYVEEVAFTPGEGGSLPAFTPFAAAPNKIGGLYIEYNHRPLLFYYEGDPVIRNRVDMKFLSPDYYGADSYTLQYSDDNGGTWANLQLSGEEVTTSSASQDNFSVENPGGDYQYRLVVNGGPQDGYISNVAEAELSPISSKFTGWGLDESMWITGIMVPNIGRGLVASFSAKKYVVDGQDEDYTDENMDFQWYRVNPVTFEMTPINGATELTYITTEADAGYDLLIRATGDGINVGGYAQIFASGENKLSNKAFVSNITTHGFTLNLYNSVDSLAVEDLILYDENWDEVEITSVTPGSNSAIYHIAADISSDLSPYKLQNNSDFWRIVSDFAGGGHMTMEGVEILLP